MNKAWLYSSLLGVATLGVAAATFTHGNAGFQFLNGAEKVGSAEINMQSRGLTEVQEFNLHVPYDQVWDSAVSELCEKDGWRLASRSKVNQIFDLKGKAIISIAPGRVNKDLDFLDGTENTDTYVVIRTVKG